MIIWKSLQQCYYGTVISNSEWTRNRLSGRVPLELAGELTALPNCDDDEIAYFSVRYSLPHQNTN